MRQLFYYKVRQDLLQSATGITKCDGFITKCDDYYKVRQYRRLELNDYDIEDDGADSDDVLTMALILMTKILMIIKISIGKYMLT